jgi:hypothetical protein
VYCLHNQCDDLSKHIYFNTRRRLYVELYDQFVTQSQGPLNICFSFNS